MNPFVFRHRIVVTTMQNRSGMFYEMVSIFITACPGSMNVCLSVRAKRRCALEVDNSLGGQCSSPNAKIMFGVSYRVNPRSFSSLAVTPAQLAPNSLVRAGGSAPMSRPSKGP
jgi:hypothetical protein